MKAVVCGSFAYDNILSFGKTFYLTNLPDRLYNVVNVNRIYEIKQFMEGVKYFEV